MIKYLGSKRLLIPRILDVLQTLQVRRVADLFSGTSRVSHALKGAGYQVTANDHNAYAHVLARCYVQADGSRVRDEAERVLEHLRGVPPREGYVTETFCRKSRFFQPDNGARIDAIRDEIDTLQLQPDLKAIALVSLMEAADRVDSTCGVQMAYLKKWAARSYNDLELRLPKLTDGPGEAWQLDAQEAAERGQWDLVYLDPPYNQHKYLNNYHIWETLVRWDAPEVYGRACKRIDCKQYRSDYNSKQAMRQTFEKLIRTLRARYILVSFSSEGSLPLEGLLELLEARGDVVTSGGIDFKRYVGAQIGVYNPNGEKVGKVSHLRNEEHLFLVDTAVKQRSLPWPRQAEKPSGTATASAAATSTEDSRSSTQVRYHPVP